MDTRLIRFTGGPDSRRSYFINAFLAKSLGRTRRELVAAVGSWPEQINTTKHGLITLSELLSMSGQTFDDMLDWATNDFTFFSWDGQGRLTLKPDNLELCILMDRLLERGVPMGPNDGSKPDTILWAWKKRGNLRGMRELAAKFS